MFAHKEFDAQLALMWVNLSSYNIYHCLVSVKMNWPQKRLGFEEFTVGQDVLQRIIMSEWINEEEK